jgi:hypothetical protein
VGAELEERVRAAFPKDGLIEVVHAPSGPAAIRDLAALRLVVLHHDDLSVRGAEAMPPPSRLVDLLDRQGANEGVRIHRNSLVFLVADRDQIDTFKDRVRRDLAARRIVNDKARMAAFAPEVSKRLRAIADSTGLEARVALTRCFCHLYFPSQDRANKYLRHEQLTAKSTGDVDKSQTKVILGALREFGKVRDTAMSTDYLRSKAWPKGAAEVTTADVGAEFWKDHGAQFVLDATLLKDAIRDGVRNGSWVYYSTEERRAYSEKDPPPSVRFAGDCVLYTCDRARELGLLGRPVRWDDVAAALQGKDAVTGADLRTVLESATGKEPTKTEVLEVLSRAAEGGEAARIVIVSGTVEPGARALPPSEIKKVGLDTLTILTSEEANRKSIQRPSSRKARAPVESVGPAGVALQALLDKATDTPEATAFALISVTATADPGEGIRDLSLLGKAIGMLPRFEIEVTTAIELDFKGLSPGIAINLTGAAREYQKVEDAVLGLAKIAAATAGTLRLDIRFAQPARFDGDEVRALRKVLTDLQPGELRLKGVLA